MTLHLPVAYLNNISSRTAVFSCAYFTVNYGQLEAVSSWGLTLRPRLSRDSVYADLYN